MPPAHKPHPRPAPCRYETHAAAFSSLRRFLGLVEFGDRKGIGVAGREACVYDPLERPANGTAHGAPSPPESLRAYWAVQSDPSSRCSRRLRNAADIVTRLPPGDVASRMCQNYTAGALGQRPALLAAVARWRAAGLAAAAFRAAGAGP